MSIYFFFFLMIRRPPRSTQSRSSAASDVYKRQNHSCLPCTWNCKNNCRPLSLIHISEPTRLGMISYAVFCLKKKKKKQKHVNIFFFFFNDTATTEIYTE